MYFKKEEDQSNVFQEVGGLKECISRRRRIKGMYFKKKED